MSMNKESMSMKRGSNSRIVCVVIPAEQIDVDTCHKQYNNVAYLE